MSDMANVRTTAAALNIWAECRECKWRWYDDGKAHKTTVTKRATVYARAHAGETGHDTLVIRAKTFRALAATPEEKADA